MSFTLSGDVISQSGTDTSLAGLSGISGVTTRSYTIAPGVTRTVYVLASRRLEINGTLTISPKTEALEFGVSAPLPEMRVNSGGTLTVQERYGTDPNWVYGTVEWVRTQRTRDNVTPSWDDSGSALMVTSGGTLNWRGGKSVLPNVTIYGTATIDYAFLEGVPFTLTTTSYLYLKSANVAINSIVTGDRIFIGVLTASSLVLQNIAVQGGTGLFGEGLYNGGSLLNVTTALNPDSVTRGFITSSIRGARMVARNVPTGSLDDAFRFQNDAGNTASAQNARIEVQKAISFTVLSPLRQPIQNAIVFTRDTNNGARKNTLRDSYTADRTYLFTSDAAGATAAQNVLTAVAYTNSTQTVTPMPVTLDRRGSGNDSNDLFRWRAWSYGHLLQDLAIEMKGSGTSNQQVTMFDDPAVTLSQALAAALTSIATLNDLYDAAKNWKCQSNAARLEYPSATTQPVTASGTTLSLGALNIVIDATAQAAFAINTGTNTITAKSSSLAFGSKFNELATTGAITFANGAVSTARLSGILTYGTPGALSPTLGTATLRFSAAGTYDLRAANISGTVTLENTSAGAVTVQLQPGVTFVNSGPNLTVDNAVSASYTVSGMVAGSRLLIRRTDTQAVLVNEVVAGTSRVYTYTHTSNIPVEIVVRKATGSPAYQEWRTTATLTASGGAVTANQQLDE